MNQGPLEVGFRNHLAANIIPRRVCDVSLLKPLAPVEVVEAIVPAENSSAAPSKGLGILFGGQFGVCFGSEPSPTGAANDTRARGPNAPMASPVPVIRLLGLNAEEFGDRFVRPREPEGDLTPSPTRRSRRVKWHAPDFGAESLPTEVRVHRRALRCWC